jgi:hypothetical protein
MWKIFINPGATMEAEKFSFTESVSKWPQRFLAPLTVATIIFGFWGNWVYDIAQDPTRAPNIVDVLYRAFQLLILHGVHQPGVIPWQLHVGRILGAALLFTAGFIAFVRFFRDELLVFRLRLPWRKNHVVVCGLGDLGLRLALDARRRGKFVVAIENHRAVAIEQAHRNGILVFPGDACDPTVLHKARLERAEFVVAACPEDQTNVAIAAQVGRLLPAALHRESPLVCRLLINDPKLREVLERQPIFPGTSSPYAAGGKSNYRINFHDLNLHDLIVRQCFRRYALDFHEIRKDHDTVVHLVVAGLGDLGKNLALYSAGIGHFANEVGKNVKIRITVADRQAPAWVAEQKQRCPELDNLCELRSLQTDRDDPNLISGLAALCCDAEKQKELVSYAICFEKDLKCEDRENLRIGLELSQRTAACSVVQTLIYQSSRCGFAALFPANGRGRGLHPRLQAFGMVEDVYTWDVLLHESEDRIASAIHEKYRIEQEKKGVPEVENPRWQHLREDFRKSSRLAADHIPIKLRALGYHIEPLHAGKPRIEQFTEDEVELLAAMEHNRWIAERRLAGWVWGPETIREKKISRALVDWAKLPASEMQKDGEQVREIIGILFKIGDGVYRV